MQPGPPRRRRARPLADAPIDELLARSDDLAKGWLLTLLEQVPLDDAPQILAGDLAREGPRVCEAVVRALASETDLGRLEQGGALELLISQAGAFAGAGSPESVLAAIDALHAVVWSAARGLLVDPYPEQVTELAERLSLVTELVRRAALRRSIDGEPAGEEEPGAPPSRSHLKVQPPPAEDAAPPLEQRDERGEQCVQAADSLWMSALQDEINRADRGGAPLSLLLVELEDVDQVVAVEPPTEVATIFGRFAHAVRSAMRRKDILACETDTRAWIVARDTGRAGAQALGTRVAGAVRNAEGWRGAPFGVSVGVAVLHEDGHDRATLIEAAEEAKFAATASGIGIVGARSEEGPDEPPAAS